MSAFIWDMISYICGRVILERASEICCWPAPPEAPPRAAASVCPAAAVASVPIGCSNSRAFGVRDMTGDLLPYNVKLKKTLKVESVPQCLWCHDTVTSRGMVLPLEDLCCLWRILQATIKIQLLSFLFQKNKAGSIFENTSN